MRGKARVIQLGLMIISTAILLVFVTFAWFATIEKTDPIIITTGTLKIESHFYKGIDSNLDGILDKVMDNDTLVDHYEEVTEEGLIFDNVIPGQIYTFRFTFKNNGSIDGVLSVDALDIIDNFNLLKNFKVDEKRFYYPSGDPLNTFTDNNEFPILFSSYKLKGKDLSTELDEMIFIFKIKIGNFGNSESPRSLTVNHFMVELVQDYGQLD
jgi:hypothetical protein